MSRRVLVGVAAAVVLVAGGVGIGVSFRSDSTEQGAGLPPAPTASVVPSGGPSTEQDPTSPPGSTPPSAVVYLCWDGTSRELLARCGSPYRAADKAKTSLSGLNWVIKDRAKRLSAYDPVCSNRTLQVRSLHRQCIFDYEGVKVCVNWSQFNSFVDGRNNYDPLGEPSTRPFGTTMELIWSPTPIEPGPCTGLPYKTAKMVASERWGVAVYSSDSGVATKALEYFGEFRPLEQWSGIPS